MRQLCLFSLPLEGLAKDKQIYKSHENVRCFENRVDERLFEKIISQSSSRLKTSEFTKNPRVVKKIAVKADEPSPPIAADKNPLDLRTRSHLTEPCHCPTTPLFSLASQQASCNGSKEGKNRGDFTVESI